MRLLQRIAGLEQLPQRAAAGGSRYSASSPTTAPPAAPPQAAERAWPPYAGGVGQGHQAHGQRHDGALLRQEQRGCGTWQRRCAQHGHARFYGSAPLQGPVAPARRRRSGRWPGAPGCWRPRCGTSSPAPTTSPPPRSRPPPAGVRSGCAGPGSIQVASSGARFTFTTICPRVWPLRRTVCGEVVVGGAVRFVGGEEVAGAVGQCVRDAGW